MLKIAKALLRVFPGTLATRDGLVAVLLPVVIALSVASAIADDAPAETPAEDVTGQENVTFGGPGSTAAQILSDEQLGAQDCQKGLASHLRLYCDFKRMLHRENGIRFGVDYNTLFQGLSESDGEDDAAGGVFRLFGTWTLLNSDSGGTGFLTLKAENRHRLGTEIAPQAMSGEFGYAGLTSVLFSDAGTLLTNLYWEHALADNRFAYVAGLVDTTDYVAAYGLANPLTDFSNLAFSNDPTVAVPGQGLGTALRWRLGENHYVVAGLADANGDPSSPMDSFDSFFDKGEYFKHVEVGRYESWDSRFDDHVHVTLWQADRRSDAGIPSGWGLALSTSKSINERWLTFLRMGFGDDGGALLDRSVSAGAAYRRLDNRGALGFGINWGRPNQALFGADARDQYTAEVYYRLQVGAHLSFTPDLQLVKDPALDPGRGFVWVVGLRARIFF